MESTKEKENGEREEKNRESVGNIERRKNKRVRIGKVKDRKVRERGRKGEVKDSKEGHIRIIKLKAYFKMDAWHSII